MSKKGTTTANVKMRSGPSMQFEPPIAFLEPNTEMEVLGEEGEWLHVRVKDKEGYVGRKYVTVAEAPQPAPTPEAKGSMAPRMAPTAEEAKSMASRTKPEEEKRFGNKM